VTVWPSLPVYSRLYSILIRVLPLIRVTLLLGFIFFVNGKELKRLVDDAVIFAEDARAYVRLGSSDNGNFSPQIFTE